MTYRLALDVGPNSVGWWRFPLAPSAHGPTEAPRYRITGSLGGGVRLFSDGRNPQDKTSFAVARRLARSMRRRRDRYLRRRADLLKLLVDCRLLPEEQEARRALAKLDPFALRAAALNEPLAPFELGRALFHLNQRRGFRSNRKTDRADSEAGMVRLGADRLAKLMQQDDARTLGEFLHRRRQSGEWVRARKRPMPNEKGKLEDRFDIYPQRDMVEREFDRIWQAQAPHHPGLLTDDAYRRLRRVIFHQRPLKPVEPGRCTFNYAEYRLPWADPAAQRRRIYEQANQLKVGPVGGSAAGLSREQRDQVAGALLAYPKRSFDQLRKLLKLPPDHRFNLESERRTELRGDETAAVLAHRDRFGKAWRGLPLERQRRIVDRLLHEEDEERVIDWLMAEAGLTREAAKATADARLPDRFCHVGETATLAILEELEADVVVYSEAARRAGYHHSDFRTGEIHDSLPYYGEWLQEEVRPGSGDPGDDETTRFGRIASPSVHIGLNQLRRLVNELIAHYGPPAQIVVELARELKANAARREEMDRRQTANRRRAEAHREKLRELGQADTGENRLRLRLYDELAPLEHCCPYSGRPISLSMLFTSAVEVDHILPFAQTLDNRVDNRILVAAEANRDKGNQTPYERFGETAVWEAVAARAEKLPAAKRRRFQPDAMEWFRRNEADFLDRHLHDVQYLSRTAKRYLAAVCDPDQIWVTPGSLTALIRGKWRLESLLGGENWKNRKDNRHHALDAAVVGLIDRSFLQRIAQESHRAADQGALEAIEIPMPWPSLREDLKAQLDRIVVSHRPDHGSPGSGRVGKFFKDTAYRVIAPPDRRGVPLVVHRVPLEDLKTAADLDAVRDEQLREVLKAATAGKEGKDFAAALRTVSETHPVFQGLRRVRVTERVSVIPVANGQATAFKWYASGGNYCFDVWRLPNGAWKAEITSLFAAAQIAQTSEIRAGAPTAKKMMRLFQNDAVAIETPEGRRIMRVVKFSINGQMQLADHHEGGNLKARDADKDDYFKYLNVSATALKRLKARKLRITPAGRVFDPGPLE